MPKLKKWNVKENKKMSFYNFISILGGVCLGVVAAFFIFYEKWNLYCYLNQSIKKE